MQTTQQKTASKDEKAVRLDKYITNNCPEISRNSIKEYLKKARVTVNGKIIKKGDFKVNPSVDEVICDNKKIIYKKHIYLMMNKPQGVVCSTKDALSPTVLSLVPHDLYKKGLFPAGRLDKDTEGFVLITDDGELAHNMLSPKKHVGKMYYVRLHDEYQERYNNSFTQGIILKSGEKCMPANIMINPKDKMSCYVILHEGMFHQVKKMFEAVGNKVEYLKRIQIGALPLDENLKLGECKEIMHKNVEKLLEKCDFKRE